MIRLSPALSPALCRRLAACARHLSTPFPFSSPSPLLCRHVHTSLHSTDAGSPVFVPALGISIPNHSPSADPATLVRPDLDRATASILDTISVLQHPVLNKAAAHLFSLHGKRIRPTIVILMAHATAASSSPPPSLPPPPSPFQTLTSLLPPLPFLPAPPLPSALLPTQLSLAEITELIHAASLLHDDVIDAAPSRRTLPSANALFGNHLAILAGDFLLARASVALARLRNCDVVVLLSTVIEHLVRGEVIQLASAPAAGGVGATDGDARYYAPDGAFEVYIAKTFFKTASLIANSSRAVALLAGHGGPPADAAYAYGENIGLAFQLVDDVLDYTSSADVLGKPVLNDLRCGHATAPLLFGLDRYPDEVRRMMERRFQGDGDVDRALAIVHEVDGVQRTRDLARHHVVKGVQALQGLPPSEARSGLINLAVGVLSRKS